MDEKAQRALERLEEIYQKVDGKNPKPKDLELLRNVLAEDPRVFYKAANLAYTAKATLIERADASAAAKEAMRMNLKALEAELGHGTASPLEDLLTEHVVLC